MAQDSDIPKKSLVEKARTDPQTFAYLFDLHYDEIFRFHSRWLHDRATAEEATSEVFLTTAKNFHRFEGDLREYRNWLYRIAAGQTASYLRSAGGSEEPQAQTVTKTAILKKAFTKLKPKVQAIIAMRLFEDMEYQQIATILKLDGAVVRSRLTAAAAKLRESLADLQTDETAKRAITSGRDDEAAIRDFLSEVEFDDHPNRAYAESLRQKLVTEYQKCLLEPIRQPIMMLQKTFIAIAAAAVVIAVTIFIITILKTSNSEQATDQIDRRDQPTTKIEQTKATGQERKANLVVTRFNAIIQMKDEGDIAGLLNMLNDENQMLSTVAATLLAEIGDVETLDALLTMIDSNGSTDQLQTLPSTEQQPTPTESRLSQPSSSASKCLRIPISSANTR
jgi:RNA polymerase sigma-70 factor (ECF subfamily)